MVFPLGNILSLFIIKSSISTVLIAQETPNEERIRAPNAVPKHMDGFAVFDPHVAIQLSRWDRSRQGNAVKHISGFYHNNPYRPKNEKSSELK